MLIAAHMSGLIDASEATRGLDYRCPACQQPVVLRHGSQIPPYFAHHPQAPCHLAGEGETRQHLLGKRQLVTFFSDWGPVTLERVLPAIQQRADGWLDLPQPVALEFQCSPISREAVAQRTAGYRRIACYPFWLLGSRYAQQKLNWRLIERFACWLTGWDLCLLFWEVDQNRLRVAHHLRQTATGAYINETAWVTTLSELVAGPAPYTTVVRNPGQKQYRSYLNQALRRATPTLRPIQEALYLTGHQVTGFPDCLMTTTLTAPIFGQGLILWRIVLTTWIEEQVDMTFLTLAELSQRALLLVSGQTTAVRFDGQSAFRQEQRKLLALLTQAGILRPTTQGWHVCGHLEWARDYTDWLENDEKSGC